MNMLLFQTFLTLRFLSLRLHWRGNVKKEKRRGLLDTSDPKLRKQRAIVLLQMRSSWLSMYFYISFSCHLFSFVSTLKLMLMVASSLTSTVMTPDVYFFIKKGTRVRIVVFHPFSPPPPLSPPLPLPPLLYWYLSVRSLSLSLDFLSPLFIILFTVLVITFDKNAPDSFPKFRAQLSSESAQKHFDRFVGTLSQHPEGPEQNYEQNYQTKPMCYCKSTPLSTKNKLVVHFQTKAGTLFWLIDSPLSFLSSSSLSLFFIHSLFLPFVLPLTSLSLTLLYPHSHTHTHMHTYSLSYSFWIID